MRYTATLAADVPSAHRPAWASDLNLLDARRLRSHNGPHKRLLRFRLGSVLPLNQRITRPARRRPVASRSLPTRTGEVCRRGAGDHGVALDRLARIGVNPGRDVLARVSLVSHRVAIETRAHWRRRRQCAHLLRAKQKGARSRPRASDAKTAPGLTRERSPLQRPFTCRRRTGASGWCTP